MKQIKLINFSDTRRAYEASDAYTINNIVTFIESLNFEQKKKELQSKQEGIERCFWNEYEILVKNFLIYENGTIFDNDFEYKVNCPNLEFTIFTFLQILQKFSETQ